MIVTELNISCIWGGTLAGILLKNNAEAAGRSDQTTKIIGIHGWLDNLNSLLPLAKQLLDHHPGKSNFITQINNMYILLLAVKLILLNNFSTGCTKPHIVLRVWLIKNIYRLISGMFNLKLTIAWGCALHKQPHGKPRAGRSFKFAGWETKFRAGS